MKGYLGYLIIDFGGYYVLNVWFDIFSKFCVFSLCILLYFYFWRWRLWFNSLILIRIVVNNVDDIFVVILVKVELLGYNFYF